MLRTSSFATTLLAAACSTTTPPQPLAVQPISSGPPAATAEHSRTTEEGAPSPEATRKVAQALERVATVRGLPAKRSVPGVELDRSELIVRVKAHVAREIPRSAIAHEGRVLELLGFVPVGFDYETETYALLEAELAGYYEPLDSTMYLASDLDPESAKATLAHELVHALQDHHFDLKQRSEYKPGQSDRAAATSALAEGDATSAMLDIMASRIGGASALDVPESVLESVMSPGAIRSNTPHVMKASLVAPYVFGTAFVHALRREGGWSRVNDAWRNAPVSTEQILHLDKWMNHEAPLPVKAPDGSALGSDWAVADEDTYGELGTRIAFAEWMPAARAKEAASGWGGDRGVLFERGKDAAFAWRIRFDAASFATRAMRHLGSALEAKLGKTSLRDNATRVTCWIRPKVGPLAVAVRGTDVTVTAGPTSETSCAGAMQWQKALAER